MMRKTYQGLWIKAPYHYRTEPKALIAIEVVQTLLPRAAMAKAMSWIVKEKGQAYPNVIKLDRTWDLFLQPDEAWLVQTPRLGMSAKDVQAFRQRVKQIAPEASVQSLPWADTPEGQELKSSSKNYSFNLRYLMVYKEFGRPRRARKSDRRHAEGRGGH